MKLFGAHFLIIFTLSLSILVGASTANSEVIMQSACERHLEDNGFDSVKFRYTSLPEFPVQFLSAVVPQDNVNQIVSSIANGSHHFESLKILAKSTHHQEIFLDNAKGVHYRQDIKRSLSEIKDIGDGIRSLYMVYTPEHAVPGKTNLAIKLAGQAKDMIDFGKLARSVNKIKDVFGKSGCLKKLVKCAKLNKLTLITPEDSHQYIQTEAIQLFNSVLTPDMTMVAYDLHRLKKFFRIVRLSMSSSESTKEYRQHLVSMESKLGKINKRVNRQKADGGPGLKDTIVKIKPKLYRRLAMTLVGIIESQ